VLDKKQALATMDVHIIRAEAEQRVRMERRTSRFTRLYPSLRWAPLNAREDLVGEASKSALRSWMSYAIGIVFVAAAIVPFYAPARDATGLKAFELASAFLIPMSLLGIGFYLRIRFHIRDVVATRYKNDRAGHGASGA
jgi:hypothetical protein